MARRAPKIRGRARTLYAGRGVEQRRRRIALGKSSAEICRAIAPIRGHRCCRAETEEADPTRTSSARFTRFTVCVEFVAIKVRLTGVSEQAFGEFLRVAGQHYRDAFRKNFDCSQASAESNDGRATLRKKVNEV